MRTESFFAEPKNRSLNFAFYHFGLLFESSHYKRTKQWWSFKILPVRDFFKGVVPADMPSYVQIGADDNGLWDDKEKDKYDKYYWYITKAIEYRRDEWAFFLLLGSIQGAFNSTRIDDRRYLEYLKLFPRSIVVKHSEALIEIFSFFDERGFSLSLKQQSNTSEQFALTKVAKAIFFE